MPLQPVEPYRRDESRWTLEIRQRARTRCAACSTAEKKSRRWEVSWTESGTRKVERELAAGVLSARRIYDGAGSLLQEEQYEDGTLPQKTLLTYAGGRLEHVRVQAADGSLIYAEQYVYGTNGTLREVKRVGTGGDTRISSYVFGPSGVSEERTSSKDTLFISRYDTRGRLASREQQESRPDDFP